MLATKLQASTSKSAAPPDRSKYLGQPPAATAFNPTWARLTLGIQPKLTMSAPNDPYEREADAVADQVMRMVAPASIGAVPIAIQRKCAACEDEKEKTIQTKRATSEPAHGTPNPEMAVRAAGRGGAPLSKDLRSYFEPRFRYDFSGVRVHCDGEAASAARAVQARAYTVGRDIVFGAGQYVPASVDGKRLVAHELTHVVQQSAPAVRRQEPKGAGEEMVSDPISIQNAESRLGGEASLGRVMTDSRSPETIQRSCLTGAPCTEPIAGAPGQMVAQGQAEAAPGRAARAAQPAPVQQAAGHGRRAASLERMARDLGLDLTTVGGIFVDMDIPGTWGGYHTLCTSFAFPMPHTGNPALGCIFFPDQLEREAETYYRDPSADPIGSKARARWEVTTRQSLIHELQHEKFSRYSAAGAASQSGCPRTLEIYRDASGRVVKTVDGYLTELSAIMSEFPPLYRGLGNQSVMSYATAWFTYKVDTASESMRGVLTALRCHCECNAVNGYIQDTFDFTSRGWTRAEKAVFNAILGSWPGLNWPLQVDPQCLPDCEAQFNQCTAGSSAFSGMGGMQCVASRQSCLSSCQAFRQGAVARGASMVPPAAPSPVSPPSNGGSNP